MIVSTTLTVAGSPGSAGLRSRGRGVRPVASWCARTGQRTTAWTRSHCQLGADLWGLIDKFPDRYSLVLASPAGDPVEVAGALNSRDGRKGTADDLSGDVSTCGRWATCALGPHMASQLRRVRRAARCRRTGRLSPESPFVWPEPRVFEGLCAYENEPPIRDLVMRSRSVFGFVAALTSAGVTELRRLASAQRRPPDVALILQVYPTSSTQQTDLERLSRW